MTGWIETPDRTTLSINQNDNFVHYAHIYYYLFIKIVTILFKVV